MKCNLCPRNCNVDRSVKRGYCKTSSVVVSRAAKHFWEEPCISGEKGSGAVFFAGCNLRCVFCQNYDISVTPHGVEINAERLADLFLYMQDTGVANVNLVTPSHFSDNVVKALELAKPRLNIPVVYNTSSYEKVSALKRLENLVDVYLPDLKFRSREVSALLANASDYFERAAEAITEMRRQQPKDVFDNGYITKGVIVRHLILPGFTEDSKSVLDWIASFDKTMYVSLMSQYFSAKKNSEIPSLNRRLFRHEYENVKDYFFNVGLRNGFSQDLDSATEEYLPDFDDGETDKILQNIPKIFA